MNLELLIIIALSILFLSAVGLFLYLLKRIWSLQAELDLLVLQRNFYKAECELRAPKTKHNER